MTIEPVDIAALLGAVIGSVMSGWGIKRDGQLQHSWKEEKRLTYSRTIKGEKTCPIAEDFLARWLDLDQASDTQNFRNSRNRIR